MREQLWTGKLSRCGDQGSIKHTLCKRVQFLSEVHFVEEMLSQNLQCWSSGQWSLGSSSGIGDLCSCIWSHILSCCIFVISFKFISNSGIFWQLKGGCFEVPAILSFRNYKCQKCGTLGLPSLRNTVINMSYLSSLYRNRQMKSHRDCEMLLFISRHVI